LRLATNKIIDNAKQVVITLERDINCIVSMGIFDIAKNVYVINCMKNDNEKTFIDILEFSS